VTLNLAEMSVAKSRPSVPHGANLSVNGLVVFAVLPQTQSTTDGSSTAAATADTEAVCEKNLLRHIIQLQDGVDDRLAMIEKQVTGM